MTKSITHMVIKIVLNKSDFNGRIQLYYTYVSVFKLSKYIKVYTENKQCKISKIKNI